MFLHGSEIEGYNVNDDNLFNENDEISDYSNDSLIKYFQDNISKFRYNSGKVKINNT